MRKLEDGADEIEALSLSTNADSPTTEKRKMSDFVNNFKQ
jgi:hypothetical protein